MKKHFSQFSSECSKHPNFVDQFGGFTDILKFQFRVIGFSETRLNDINPDFVLKDYSYQDKNRQIKSGGGVALDEYNILIFFERNNISLNNAT